MSDSLGLYGPQPARLLCPWDSSGMNTGVGCDTRFQEIFPTQGSNLCFLCLLHWQAESSEKALAPHSSTLAWKIPWTEEPGGLQSMGSLGVGHDQAASLSLFTFMHWRRKQQPTPVFLPGESRERWSLVGCRLWGHTESDMTEATQQQQQHHLGSPFLSCHCYIILCT